MVHPLMLNLLEDSVEALRAELKVLETINFGTPHGLYITHDNDHHLIVHSTIVNKAYIPKRYDGWPVTFIEWDGESELELDLDHELM